MANALQLLKDWINELFSGHPKWPGQKNGARADSHLEPKYWPEVMHFMDHIHKIINTHTIDDDNIHIVNQRILDYMVKEINAKGSIEDIDQRYDALNTLADRILVNNLSKIVGLKQSEFKGPEFSDAIAHFKQALQKRRETEILQQATKN